MEGVQSDWVNVDSKGIILKNQPSIFSQKWVFYIISSFIFISVKIFKLREGRIDYGARVYRKPKGKPQKGDEIKPEKHSSHIIPEQERIDFSTAHSAFFATKAVKRDSVHPPVAIQAMVNGE